jgi:hypothetical protein
MPLASRAQALRLTQDEDEGGETGRTVEVERAAWCCWGPACTKSDLDGPGNVGRHDRPGLSSEPVARMRLAGGDYERCPGGVRMLNREPCTVTRPGPESRSAFLADASDRPYRRRRCAVRPCGPVPWILLDTADASGPYPHVRLSLGLIQHRSLPFREDRTPSPSAVPTAHVTGECAPAFTTTREESGPEQVGGSGGHPEVVTPHSDRHSHSLDRPYCVPWLFSDCSVRPPSLTLSRRGGHRTMDRRADRRHGGTRELGHQPRSCASSTVTGRDLKGGSGGDASGGGQASVLPGLP